MDGIQTVAENVDQIMGCHCDALVSLIDSYVDKRYHYPQCFPLSGMRKDGGDRGQADQDHGHRPDRKDP